MIFHSLEFLIFLPVVLFLYWMLPHRGQNILLLAASYFFYGYIKPWFVVLLIAATLVDFTCGIGVEKYPHRKRWFLVASLCATLGMLGFFKYFGFFVENVTALLRAMGYQGSVASLHIILPVGISFYTFQSVSYIVDVYKGHIRACRNLLDYAAYVGFFPQLVAGPIERPGRLLPQMQGKRFFNAPQWQEGLFLICWGFFKKLVIADNVAVTCNKIFALNNPTFPLLWTGVFAFCIQIFADFSAYTDIARGTAKLLGFELMENFKHPYFSRSPSEFWKRWHISLSTWFRDYVYIPLGGSRVTMGRGVFNLVLTFFLSGLWHGAQWNFILWGLWWGMLVAVEHVLGHGKKQSAKTFSWKVPFQILFTFVLTNIGWLMFRETDLQYLLKYLTLNPFSAKGSDWRVAYYLWLIVFLYSIPIWIHHATEFMPAKWFERVRGNAWTLAAVRAVGMAALFTAILLFRSQTTSDFIYFQF